MVLSKAPQIHHIQIPALQNTRNTQAVIQEDPGLYGVEGNAIIEEGLRRDFVRKSLREIGFQLRGPVTPDEYDALERLRSTSKQFANATALVWNGQGHELWATEEAA